MRLPLAQRFHFNRFKCSSISFALQHFHANHCADFCCLSVAGAQSLAITKILVANRSEIAIRVFRAANELGLKTVAIWAEEDKYSLHRFKADESYQVGRGPHLTRDMGPIESYLSIEEVIRVARLSGADA